MISLTDRQLAAVMAVASRLSPERRTVLLEQVAAALDDCLMPTDADVANAVRVAVRLLIEQSTTAA